MNGSRHLRTIAFRRNARNNNSTLFSIRSAAVFFFLLSTSVTAKTSEQEAAFKGRDDGSAVRNTADGDSSDALGDPSGDAIDRQNAVNLLRILSGMDGSGFDGKKMRNWTNRESLRVWGKREDEDKSSFRGDGGAVSLGSSVHRTGDDTGVDLLMTLKERLADDRRPENGASPAYEGDAGKFRSAFPFGVPLGQNVEDDGDAETRPSAVSSGGLDLRGMPPALRGLDEKRKWERNALRIWGKRDAASEFSGDFKDQLTYPNMRRRKWENLPLRVWGK